MADVDQPRAHTVPAAVMPSVDAAPYAAQLRVFLIHGHAVGPNETMPANGTPGGVIVVVLLGRA